MQPQPAGPEAASSFIQVGELAMGSGSGASDKPARCCGIFDTLRQMRAARKKPPLACRLAVRFANQQTVRFAVQRSSLLTHLEPGKLSRAYSVVLLSRVYIGRLAPGVTEGQLTDLLAEFGPMSFVGRLFMHSSKNKGFAFVNFHVPEAALLAIESLNCTRLCGQQLRVSRPFNQPSGGALLMELSRECPDWDRRLYVANVPPAMSEADLRHRLGAFGRVVDLWLERPPNCLPAYGFVTFAEPASAEAALLAAPVTGRVDKNLLRLRLGRVVVPPDVATGCLLPRQFGDDGCGLAPSPSSFLSEEACEGLQSLPAVDSDGRQSLELRDTGDQD